MKRIFLSILFVFALVGQCLGVTNYPKLEVYNNYNGDPAYVSCYNNGWLYGNYGDFVTIKRIQPDTGQTWTSRTAVTTLNANFQFGNSGPTGIHSTSVNDLIFVEVWNTATSNYYLIRSSDGGSTLTNVFTYGQGNGAGGTDTPNVRMLGGFCEVTTTVPGAGGLAVGTLLLGEYNVNGSRVAGGTNDRVRILKSTDQGVTWSAIMTWNTNGTNQIGHVHNIKQDPYTGYIYILTGDTDNKAAIIRWDGAGAWQDNTTPANIGALSGFAVATGTQRERSVDILFTSQYAFTFTDCSLTQNPTEDGSHTGIWRWNKDLSSPVRMSNDIWDYNTSSVGWFGTTIGDNLIFTTAYEGEANLPLNLIYMSSDGGQTWVRAAGAYTRTTSTTFYPLRIFSNANMAYYMQSYSALYACTNVLQVTGTILSDELPNIIHPIIFTGTWNAAGADTSSTGQSKDAPRATLNYSLSNRITGGTRVLFPSGTITENSTIYAQWNNTSGYYCSNQPVTIEGQGMSNSVLCKTGSTSYFLALDTTRIFAQGLVVKNIQMYNTIDRTLYLYAGTPYVSLINARIGTTTAPGTNNTIGISSSGSTLTVLRSWLSGGASNMPIVTVSSGLSGVVQSYKSTLFTHGDGLYIRGTGGSFTCINTVFDNFPSKGIVIYSGVDVQPTIKNCIFNGQVGSNSISDNSGQTENAVDYNCYKTANTNVTDGGHSLSVGTNPLFVNSSAFNYKLLPGSPCINVGLTSALPDTDFEGKVWISPDIGAYAFRSTGFFGF